MVYTKFPWHDHFMDLGYLNIYCDFCIKFLVMVFPCLNCVFTCFNGGLYNWFQGKGKLVIGIGFGNTMSLTCLIKCLR